MTLGGGGVIYVMTQIILIPHKLSAVFAQRPPQPHINNMVNGPVAGSLLIVGRGGLCLLILKAVFAC